MVQIPKPCQIRINSRAKTAKRPISAKGLQWPFEACTLLLYRLVHFFSAQHRDYLPRILSWFYWITPCLRLCRWKCTSSVPSVSPRSRCVKLPNNPSRYLRWDRIWSLNCWGLYLRTLYRMRSLLKWCLCWSLLGPRTVILGPWWGFFHPWKTIPVIIRAIIKVLSLQPQNSTIFKHFVHDFSYWLNVFCLRIQV